MINLHYEIRICQKIYNRVTMTVYVKCVVRFNVHKMLIYLSLLQPKKPGLHNGIIRGCTKIQDNMCLRQGSGGACSCSSDFCNIAVTQILNLQMITFSICLNMIVMKIS